jgi:hypothetical protein
MRIGLLALVMSVVLAAASPGDCAWSRAANGNGASSSKTISTSTGNVPSATVASHAVTLTWSASQFAGGGNVPSYVIKRYDALTNALQTVLAGCSGRVASTSCTENGVPTGTWTYTVTPAAGNNWRGIESAKSSNVVVLV